jgi:hypothetical protein
MTEAEALKRLIDAARAVANLCAIDHKAFIVSAEIGRSLREALAAYDEVIGDDDHEEA